MTSDVRDEWGSPYPAAFPGEAWECAEPAAQGMDAAALRRAMEALEAVCGEQGIRQALVARHGRIVWQGDDVTNVHNVWSVTKSFTSTCLGLLVDDRRVTLNTPAAEAVPALGERYPDVTMRHLATMTSGYRAAGDDEIGGHGQSRTPLVPAEPLFPPGERFLYWDSAMNQFAHVLTRIAGESLASLFGRRVAEPLGMARWRWEALAEVDGVAVNGGAGNLAKGIHICALDLARFGLLFLHRGVWAGQRILSSEWVATAANVQVSDTVPAHHAGKEGPGLYGLNWWTNGYLPSGERYWPGAAPGTYYASGFNNNCLVVVPEWDVVAVRVGTDGSVEPRRYGEFLQLLGRAIVA